MIPRPLDQDPRNKPLSSSTKRTDSYLQGYHEAFPKFLLFQPLKVPHLGRWNNNRTPAYSGRCLSSAQNPNDADHNIHNFDYSNPLGPRSLELAPFAYTMPCSLLADRNSVSRATQGSSARVRRALTLVSSTSAEAALVLSPSRQAEIYYSQ